MNKDGVKVFAIPRMDDEFALADEVEDYSKVQLFRDELDTVKETSHEKETLIAIKTAQKKAQ